MITKENFVLMEGTEEELIPLYARNGLEISEDQPVSTDAIKSWKLVIDGKTAGGCTLAKRQGEYILDGIAIEPEFRMYQLGTVLLNAALDYCVQLGGKRMYLVARAPDFFQANGFEEVERKDSPEFFECFGCDQYNKTCFPKVMKKEL